MTDTRYDRAPGDRPTLTDMEGGTSRHDRIGQLLRYGADLSLLRQQNAQE
jgi:hypothetical protein